MTTGAALEFLSDAWAAHWRDYLNRSPAFLASAASWDGDLCLAITDTGLTMGRAVYLSIHGGSCRTARSATPEELDTAAVVLTAQLKTWQGIFSGALSPALAVFTGQVTFRRGGIADLLPHIATVKELFKGPLGIPTVFSETPDD